MNPETTLQNLIMLAIGRLANVRLFRNTVGVGWVGRLVRHSGGEALIRPAVRTTFGLAIGSADLIGWRSVVVTPDMVGKTIAQFVSIEVKTSSGRLSPEQVTWRDAVEKAGGCAAVVRSVDEATMLL